jgi:hypothetical protein
MLELGAGDPKDKHSFQASTRRTRRPGWRFNLRTSALTVAIAALVLGGIVGSYSWLIYPHVELTIFNETATAISDIRVKFSEGECTAERIEPGGTAVADILTGAGMRVYITYRDSNGTLKEDKVIYESYSEGSYERGRDTIPN